jgi:hypothetical protein
VLGRRGYDFCMGRGLVNFRVGLNPALSALLLLTLCARPAAAQSATGEIDLQVVEATTSRPLGNVRTFLLGAQTANALTNASGAIKFTDVPIGIYRMRVTCAATTARPRASSTCCPTAPSTSRSR